MNKKLRLLFLSLLAVLMSTTTYAGQKFTYTFNGGSATSNPAGYFSYDTSGKWNFNAKYTGCEYDGKSYSNGLKMEGSTKIMFTSTTISTVTIVQSTWSANTIVFDGTELAIADAEQGTGCRVYTISDVAAGDHNITRGSGESGLFLVSVEYDGEGGDTPVDPEPDDPDPDDQDPVEAPDITGMSVYYWDVDNFAAANLQTFADGATIQITGKLDKTIANGNDITIGNKKYRSMKLSNGAQNTYVAPDGYAATKVVFFSYVNAEEGDSYWKEVNGVKYEAATSGGYMKSFKDGANPDFRTYEFSSPVKAFTFTNTGKQLCYVMAVELEESAAELVKIPAAGYATYVATGNVAVPEGVEAFIVTGVYDTYVSLQGINNVAAGTPVILKGNEGYYTLPVLEGDAVDASANMLRASNGDVSGSGIYVLANQNNVVGFYPLGADVVIPAGKAYLQVEGEAKSFLALEGDVTAINNVEAASAHTSTIYNVAGQKVQNIKASGLYIVNGKKVFVK